MSYWEGQPPTASNLRLLEPGSGWKQHDDKKDADGRPVFQGAARQIELSLSTALNASNLVLLTGAGSSFCARNPETEQQAPGMRTLWKEVEKAASAATMAGVIQLIPAAKDVDNIEKLLTLCKIYVTLFADDNAAKVQSFIDIAETTILRCVSFVSTKTDLASHRQLVRKIARRGIRKPRTRIFTTNYDLCFEYAAQGQQFVVVDGFSHSFPQIYDRAHFSYDIVRREAGSDAPDYIENVFQLYKLHGSSDWRRRADGMVVRSQDNADGKPVLIYPRDTKYQEAFESPYLDMMSAFQAALREKDTALVVSGFGFNDDHIARPIMAALEANMSLRLILCDVNFLRDDALETGDEVIDAASPMREANEYFERFKALCAHGDTRITLLSGRFEDLSAALPDLVAQTERERHAERLQLVRALPSSVSS